MDSATLEILPHGCVAPLTQMTPARPNENGWFDGGAYYEDGSVCSLGLVQKSNHKHEPAPLDVRDIVEVAGRFVYGAMLQNEHFGHFFSENFARLWALDQLDEEYKTVVFFARSPKIRVAKFIEDAFNVFFPNLSLFIVKQPTRFERLAVPQEIMKSGYVYGHSLIRPLVTRFNFADQKAAKKLFVSRSRLSRGEGGILADTAIDDYLAAEGYKIIHPEKMSIREQLNAYTSAEQLIFADGSALHLYAFAAREDQQVFVIWRRNKNEIFSWQVQSFGGPPLQGEPSIRELWVPEIDYPDAARGKAVLSFADLSKQLAFGGFINGPLWDEPDKALLQGELDSISAEKNRKFVLRPIRL